MRTRSAYLRSPWEVDIREVELPDIPPDDHVLLQVEACGICGSDLNNAQEGAESWQPFGHEIAGRIVAVGAHCGTLQPGDKVVLESSGFCGTCDYCRNGILTYIGFGSDGAIQFDANDFHLRKLQLRASFASPALYYPIVLGLLKNGTIPGDLLLSHKVKLADIGEAMNLCRNGKGSIVKVVVTP